MMKSSWTIVEGVPNDPKRPDLLVLNEWLDQQRIILSVPIVEVLAWLREYRPEICAKAGLTPKAPT